MLFPKGSLTWTARIFPEPDFTTQTPVYWDSAIFHSRFVERLTSAKTAGARTQRTLARGTAKRLAHKHAKPRPIGRALGRLCAGL